MRKMPVLIALVALAMPALAAESPMSYLDKAGAGDLYEQTSSRIVLQSSKNAKVRGFASMMIEDHGKSTAMLKSAAAAEHIKASPPRLTPDQQTQIAALNKATGSARDTLYWSQQKTVHAQALRLHQDYAANGANDSLKDAAAKIVPVVKHHIDLLNGRK